MEQTITIAVICGTSREGRETAKAAQWAAEIGRKQPGGEIIFVDPAEYSLPGDGRDVHDPRYSEITAKADAFYIVTPEYNHSFPVDRKSTRLNSSHSQITYAVFCLNKQ